MKTIYPYPLGLLLAILVIAFVATKAYPGDQLETGTVILKLSDSAELSRGQGTWTPVDSPARKTLLDIDMVDESLGWAVGTSGAILKYEGSNWKTASSPIAIDLTSVEMRNEQEGWAIGSLADDTLILLEYKDLKWTKLGNTQNTWRYAEGTLTEVDITEQQHRWLSWADYFDINLYGTSKGVVVGGQLVNGHMVLSALNASGNWDLLYESNPPTAILGLSLLDNGAGWGVGVHTTLKFEAGDILTSWPKSAYLPAVLTAVSTVNRNEAWAVGVEGVIAHYNGDEWVLYETNLKDVALFDIDMVSKNEGWAAGSQGTILHYLDGVWYIEKHARWDLFRPTSMHAIDMISEEEGWAVGSYGQIWHYQAEQ